MTLSILPALAVYGPISTKIGFAMSPASWMRNGVIIENAAVAC